MKDLKSFLNIQKTLGWALLKGKNKETFKPEKYSFELWNYYDKLNLNIEDKDSENEELN